MVSFRAASAVHHSTRYRYFVGIGATAFFCAIFSNLPDYSGMMGEDHVRRRRTHWWNRRRRRRLGNRCRRATNRNVTHHSYHPRGRRWWRKLSSRAKRRIRKVQTTAYQQKVAALRKHLDQGYKKKKEGTTNQPSTLFSTKILMNSKLKLIKGGRHPPHYYFISTYFETSSNFAQKSACESQSVVSCITTVCQQPPSLPPSIILSQWS